MTAVKGWRSVASTYAEYREIVEAELRRAYLEDVPMDRPRAARLVAREVARVKRGGVGVLKPGRCERCGAETPAPALQGHHVDYARPLHVYWLCRCCHRSVHLGEPLLIDVPPVPPTRSVPS